MMKKSVKIMVSIPLREDTLSNVKTSGYPSIAYDLVSIPLREDTLSNP